MTKKILPCLFSFFCAINSIFAFEGVDFNGDGNDDLVNVWGGLNDQMSANVFLSNGSTFTKETWADDQGGFWAVQRWFYGDFNGDGNTDIAKLWDDNGAMSCDVHVSDGSSFSVGMQIRQQGTFSYIDKWFTGDFNGDGMTDLARGYNNGSGRSFDVFLSNGNGFDSVATWASGQGGMFAKQFWLSGDYNGDGRTDIMVIHGDTQMSADMHISNGNNFGHQVWATNQGGKSSKMKWLSADFDGDGMTDVAKLWWNDNGQISVDVHRSTGSALTMQSWVSNMNANFDRHDFWVKGDFNGDGRADIARLKESNNKLSMDVLQSSGTAFALNNVIVEAINHRDQARYQVGDYNGDGSSDIAVSWSNGTNTNFRVLTPSSGTSNNFGSQADDNYFKGRPVRETVFGDSFINYGQIEGPVPNSANLQAILDAGNDLYLQKGITYRVPDTLNYARDYQRIETYNALFLSEFATFLLVLDNGERDSILRGRNNTDYISLRHAKFDGNKYNLPPKVKPEGGEGAMVAFGAGDGHWVRRVVLQSTRTWSSLQFHEAANARDNLVEGIYVLGAGNGPRSNGRKLDETATFMNRTGWNDGISVGAERTLIRNNFIMDCTDVGIVIFGGPDSEASDNMIFSMSRACLGAINLVDGIDKWNIGTAGQWPMFDYRGVKILNNRMAAYGARIHMGIPFNNQPWQQKDPKVFNHNGGLISGNQLEGGAFGYGYVLLNLRNINFANDNVSIATHSGKGMGSRYNNNNPDPATAFLYDPSNITFDPDTPFNAGKWTNNTVTISHLLYMNGNPKNGDGFYYYDYTTAEANAIVRASYLEMLGRQPTNNELTNGRNFFLNNNRNTGDDLKRDLMNLAEFKSRFGNINPNSNALHPFRVKRWFDVVNSLDTQEIKGSGNYPAAQKTYDDALTALQFSRNATFVSVDTPAQVAPGDTFTATVTVQNDSSLTWSRADGFKLGSQNPQDNSTWGTDRIQMDEESLVFPGETYTYSRTFTAPATEGVYDFQWKMVQEGVSWFGPNSNNVTIEVTEFMPDSAEFVSQNIPLSVQPGEVFNAELTFRNNGTTTWTAAAGYKLVSQNPQDNTTWGANGRVDVQGSVAPGQTHTFTIACTAPNAEGSFDFRRQMIQEGGVGTFGEQSANLSISVMPQKPVGLVERTDDAGATYSAQSNTADAANAFDNNINSKYQASGASAWIQHQFAGANQHTVKWYTVTSAMEGPLEPGSANMLNNGSFENALNNANNWTASSSGNATLSTNQSQAGSQSLRLSANGSISPTTQSVALAANTDYEVTAWILNSGQTGGRAILDSNDVFDSPTGPNGPGGSAQLVIDVGQASTWTKYTGTFNSGSETSITLRLFTNADFAGTMFFDSISIHEAPVPGNAVPHDPASWILSGSNDGSSWSSIDSRSGVAFSGRGETREFSALSNNTAYEYYRLEMTSNGGNQLQIAEIELWCEDIVVVDPYCDWLATFGLSCGDPGTARSDDYDGDGISNLGEYSMDSNPDGANEASKQPDVVASDSNIEFKFRRNRSDITYTIQKSTDLANWTDYMTVNDSHGTVGSDATVPVPNTEMAAGKLFLRLKMED